MAQTAPKQFAAAPALELQESQPVAAAPLQAVVSLVAGAAQEVVLPAFLRSQQCCELTLDQLWDPCFAEVQQSRGSSR